MICGKCGTQNPDGAATCSACGQPLVPASQPELQMQGAPSQPTQGQPMQAQPAQGQPVQGQPMQGQPMQAQPMPGQPMPDQPFPGQPFPGQPMPGQPMPDQPFPGQPMPGQPFPGQPFPPQGTEPVVKPPKKNPLKSIPKGVLIGVPIAIVALIVIICLVVSGGKTIDLNDYLTIEATGYDGYGYVSADIDWDAIKEDYGDKISYTGKANSSLGEFGSLLSMLSAVDAIESGVDVDFDQYSGLSNGQTVNYTWDIEEKMLEYIDVKLKYEDGSYEVTNLTPIGKFNAFEGLSVSFYGTSPNGSAEIEYSGSELSRYDFSLDKSYDLSNGDVVTVKIDTNADYFAQNYGKVPDAFEKQFTVSGLDSYISKLDQITETSLAAMQAQAEDVFSAKVARDWDDDEEKLVSFTYIGDYLMTNKTYASDNYLYLVYEVKVRNLFTTDDEDAEKKTFDHTTTYYWYIRFSDVLVQSDGELNVNLTNYSTTYNTVRVESDVDDGWYTKSWSYYGYKTANALYKDVILSNIDSYNHEDNITETK